MIQLARKSTNERLQAEAQAFHKVVSCLRDMKLEHGLCQPRSRRACAHCNSRDELELLVAAYRGPHVILSGVSDASHR